MKIPKVLEKIGQGGYGVVFKGKMGSKNVAIKFQKNSQNARTEGTVLAKLIGTGIAPRLYTSRPSAALTQNWKNLAPKITNTNKGHILIQNLINGKPLKNFMTGPPLNSALKQRIISQVNKMHAEGVIHGNLHRNNIIVNKNGKPVIIDFGKALFKNTGGWKNMTEANEYVKGFGKGFVEKYGKKFYYSNDAKTRSHQANGNFLKRLK
jgi:predicted Ser/Thr protein kinase